MTESDEWPEPSPTSMIPVAFSQNMSPKPLRTAACDLNRDVEPQTSALFIDLAAVLEC